jgi:hypothetical protein
MPENTFSEKSSTVDQADQVSGKQCISNPVLASGVISQNTLRSGSIKPTGSLRGSYRGLRLPKKYHNSVAGSEISEK